MVGAYHIIVQNANVKYEFDINRNITILKGDSATGKTVLIDMIREYALNGEDSGITVSSKIPCRVIDGNTWKEQLRNITESIVFIDEGNRFVISEDFAKEVQVGKNYYVIVTRESLANLPYSVTEIYGIHSSGKYESFEPVYHEMYRIYDKEIKDYETTPIKPDCIVVEDSNSGFEFFIEVVKENDNIKCISAMGKSNVFKVIQEMNYQSILIVADGAAFGAEMGKIYEYMCQNSGVHLYLPESFEWIILKSGIINATNIRDVLEHTENYVESEQNVSWERFYTNFLMQETKDTYLQYSKKKLNDSYKQDSIKTKILNVMQGIDIQNQ